LFPGLHGGRRSDEGRRDTSTRGGGGHEGGNATSKRKTRYAIKYVGKKNNKECTGLICKVGTTKKAGAKSLATARQNEAGEKNHEARAGRSRRKGKENSGTRI